MLADVVYPGGKAKMKKACPAYGEIGKIKSEWSVNIGRHMDWDNNKSPSFQFFASEINRRVVEVFKWRSGTYELCAIQHRDAGLQR